MNAMNCHIVDFTFLINFQKFYRPEYIHVSRDKQINSKMRLYKQLNATLFLYF